MDVFIICFRVFINFHAFLNDREIAYSDHQAQCRKDSQRYPHRFTLPLTDQITVSQYAIGNNKQKIR